MLRDDFHWFQHFQTHYLDNYLAQGGSKVKLLTGEPARVQPLLERLAAEAQAAGYATILLSAREIGRRLNELPNLYRTLTGRLDLEALAQGLCARIARELGYGPERYAGGPLLPLLMAEGLQRSEALREIRQATGTLVRELDMTVSFGSFVYALMRECLVAEHPEGLQTALRWLRGDKLERGEKQSSGLYESLNRANARCWLNSLIHLLTAGGRRGLVVLVGELEVITERSPSTQRFLYTPSAIKDTCELFRQLIDDVELMRHFLLVLGGGPALLTDEKRGFKSYEALWMRLQTGLVPGKQINLLADLLPADAVEAAA